MEPNQIFHVVAMPFPGRGHINPMMNLCKLIASRKPDILISFVVTEEWLSFIKEEPKPEVVRFATIPNVIPPEHLKAVDFPGFYKSVMTQMEFPFEQLLDRLEPSVDAIIGDVEVCWVFEVGYRRNVPVAAFWTMSASFFSMLYHFYFFKGTKKSAFGCLDNMKEIPGLDSSQVSDLKIVFEKNDLRVLQLAMECTSKVSKAKCLLFTSVYELEAQTVEILKPTFPFPIYSVGPVIPYLELEDSPSETDSSQCSADYLKWLDSKPNHSVLYISLGSFLSVSSTQIDEIIAGLEDCGISYLWIARKDALRMKNICSANGLILPWCDQLKVLCHPSIGGFWTHCGWNSTLEAIFAGVPLLTFPLFLDQYPNSTQIVEDWRIGLKVKEKVEKEMITRRDVAELVSKFMSSNGNEQKEIRIRARELAVTCRQAIAGGGSPAADLTEFLSKFLQH